MSSELLLVKLGGSIITFKDKPFSEDLKTIRRLAREIHEARREKDFRLIVGHGGGSYPHIPAKIYRTAEGIINEKSYEGIAKVQDAASRLNRIIVREFIEAGENAVSFHLSSSSISENGEIKQIFLEPIKKLLDFNMLPVPYGDVCFDLKKGCSILSTEMILSYFSRYFTKANEKYKVSRIIFCTDVEGVYTRDPKKDPLAKLIPKVTPKTFEKIKKYVGGSLNIDVTGGMIHKVKSALELAKLGIDSLIIDGRKPGLLRRALLGEKGLGTIITKD